MNVLLGIDIGTTTIKAALIDAASVREIGRAEREYPIHQPHPGWAEQNPADWWAAVVEAVQRALAAAAVNPGDVQAIGISGQMHGTVLLDRALQPLRPAIIWADSRSSQQVEALSAAGNYADHAPGPPAAGFMAATLMWLARHEPDSLAAAHVVLLPKDYVRLQLTGEVGTDPGDAAATWLFDVREGQWSAALLELCGLAGISFPPVIPSAAVAGVLCPPAAQALGLPPGIPVVAGSGDLPCQALGCGLIDPGTALLTVGTGGQVFHPAREPRTDPAMRLYVFNHAAAGRWYAQAAILAAGLSLRWLRDLLGVQSYEALTTLAADISPGADGLVFLPYLLGERTPHMDPSASGALVGLRLHHGPGHLARAVMEGVAFALADCLDLIREHSPSAPPRRLLFSGGAARSPLWGRILASVLDAPLELAERDVPACIGAALLAGVGAGVYTSLHEAAALLPRPDRVIEPDRAAAARYRALLPLYRDLYPRLRSPMHCLTRR
ncbi:MAG: xylulokinase [Anaerolineae bacterium]